MAERIFRADFYFWAAGFFRGFLAGFFLLIFVGKSAQKNPPGKSPAKSSKFYTTKIPDTFLQRGRTKIFVPRGTVSEISKPPVKTRSLVTGAMVPPLGCFRAP